MQRNAIASNPQPPCLAIVRKICRTVLSRSRACRSATRAFEACVVLSLLIGGSTGTCCIPSTFCVMALRPALEAMMQSFFWGGLFCTRGFSCYPASKKKGCAPSSVAGQGSCSCAKKQSRHAPIDTENRSATVSREVATNMHVYTACTSTTRHTLRNNQRCSLGFQTQREVARLRCTLLLSSFR